MVVGIIILILFTLLFYLLHGRLLSPKTTFQISPKTVVSEPTKPPQPTSTATVDVTLTPNGFSPQTITIHAYTRVVWINKSGTEATVNSDPHPVHTAYPPLNLGIFGKIGRLSLVFPKPGHYGYHNHFDANQTGTVIVN